MSQTKNNKHPLLRLKKETVRALDRRTLSDDQLAQVAGGTYIPRQTCRCD